MAEKDKFDRSQDTYGAGNWHGFYGQFDGPGPLPNVPPNYGGFPQFPFAAHSAGPSPHAPGPHGPGSHGPGPQGYGVNYGAFYAGPPPFGGPQQWGPPPFWGHHAYPGRRGYNQWFQGNYPFYGHPFDKSGRHRPLMRMLFRGLEHGKLEYKDGKVKFVFNIQKDIDSKDVKIKIENGQLLIQVKDTKQFTQDFAGLKKPKPVLFPKRGLLVIAAEKNDGEAEADKDVEIELKSHCKKSKGGKKRGGRCPFSRRQWNNLQQSDNSTSEESETSPEDLCEDMEGLMR